MSNLDHMTPDNAGIISLHFDVPKHAIPLRQFVNSAQSLEIIIDDFNRELFDDELKYEIFVIPPQEGGLLELFKLVLGYGSVGIASALAFLSSDLGKKYVKGLTGYEPIYFAEKLGKNTNALFSGKKSHKETESEASNRNKLVAVLVAIIIAQMVAGFIKSEPDDMQKLGLTKKKHREAYAAKNAIIQGCLDNRDVSGLGFDATHEFPIRRPDFSKHIVDLPSMDENNESLPWITEVADIQVYSPNWRRMGKRQWQGDTKDVKQISFSIEDDCFWGHVDVKDIQPAINDNMRVQWAYSDTPSKKPSNVRVLRVLTYNGMPISERLSEEELAVLLGGYSQAEPEAQQDLFEPVSPEEGKGETAR